MLSRIAHSFRKTQTRLLFHHSHTRCRSTLSAVDKATQDVYTNEHECLAIKWDNGNVDEFPFVYLRENCRCSACYTDQRKSRTMYSPKDINVDITAESAGWNSESGQLEVKWDDGHVSHYSSDWLKYLRYRPPGEGQPDGLLSKGIKLWGPEMSKEENMPTFEFEKLLNDEQEVYKWLRTLISETGITKIENTPKEKGQLLKLSERVGYLMKLSYGSFFEVRAFSDDATHELGYTDSYLPIHTDYSFTQAVPFIGMLHCVEQTQGKGGGNLWVDGFHVANRLFEENPEYLDTLVNTPVDFTILTKTKLGEVCEASRRPLIRLDRDKKLKQMCYSDEFRSNVMSLEPKLMKSFYKAYFRYSELLYDKKSSFEYKMRPGDMMAFNNFRILHARSEYKDRSDNVRLLEIGYFDWDCAHSRFRILAAKQGLPPPA